MPRNLVLFDLEWNIGYQPYTFNYHGVQQTFRGEIVEIGAVKIDEDANVLDTFSIHLRPRIFRKLHQLQCTLKNSSGMRSQSNVSDFSSCFGFYKRLQCTALSNNLI